MRTPSGHALRRHWRDRGRRSRQRYVIDPGRYHGQFRAEFSRLHLDPDLLWVTPLRVRYIVGIVGFRGVGKTSVLSYLSEKKGFEVYSLSTFVRREAERRGVPLDLRDLLQDIGDEMRSEHGHPGDPREQRGDGAYLARLVLRRIHARHHTHHAAAEGAARVALAGFKHPDEVSLLRRMENFQTLLVSSDDQVRADRALDTGLLPRELEALGIVRPQPPVLSQGLSCEDFSRRREEYRETMRMLFFEHLDRRDKDGRTANPWAGDLAQGVERIMADADALLAEERHQERKTVSKIDNNQDFRNDDADLGASLYKKVDLVVNELERKFRGP